MPLPSKLPHQLQRKTPEQVYAWYERDLQRRKKINSRIHPNHGKRWADEDGAIHIRFADGTEQKTGEVLPKTVVIPNPLLSDPRLDKESRLNLNKNFK